MAVIETWLHQDLQEPVKVNHLDGNLFSNNGNGNRIGVVLTNNGEALASISGTVSGYVVTADGSTVPCTGSKSGNRASILIPAAAYQPGSIFITVFVTDGTTVTTVAAVSTTVIRSRTNAQVDPGSAVTDWTQTINAAMQSVETAAANLGGIVAVPYASITFPVPLGKYTYYNNNLYRCITPIESSESFTAAHWTQVRLGDDVSDLKSAFVDEAISEFGTVDIGTPHDGQYIAKSNGKQSNSIAWVFAPDTGFFSVHGKALLITAPEHSNATVLENVASVAFYTAQTTDTYISDGTYEIISGTSGVYRWAIVPIPSTANYYRVSIPKSILSDYKIVEILDVESSFYGTRETLTSSNDLNTLTSPGVYYWASSSIPQNAPPSFEYAARLMVVKSPTTGYHFAEWQILITRNNVVWYRYCYTVEVGWSDWQEINPAYFITVAKSLLTSSDDLNEIEKSGMYAYSTNNKPANSPPVKSNQTVRLFVVKSSNSTSHTGEWQIATFDGTFFFRTCDGTTWTSWNVINNDFPQYGNLAYLSFANDHKILQSDLTIASYAYTSCTDYIAIPEDAKAVKVAAKTKNGSNETVTILPQVFFFDENKNYISRNRTANDSYGVFDIPLTAKYIRANQPASTVTDLPHLIQFVKYSDTYTPAYQVEELPYNAVLYHQKWDDLLEDTTADHVLRRVDLGNVDDDENLPIYAYEFCPNRYMVGLNSAGTVSTPVSFDWTNALYERPKVLILGGVHGNEKCTPMDILTVVKMLKSKKYNDIACKFDWYIIPLVNPWGYSHAHLDSNGDIVYDNSSDWTEVVDCSAAINAGIRDNGHGMNINRDWSDVTFENGGKTYGFQTPELQLIKNYVLSVAPDFFIDVHQNHTDKTVNGTMSLTLCHAGAPIDPNNQDAEYVALMKKIYRYIDVANADTNEIALGYATNNSTKYQTCRIWPTVKGTTSEHYFGGVTVTSGGTVLGNTEHQAIKTPYSLCSETSEICADFANTTDWYNPVARTISYSYLWNIIKQIAKLF